LISKHFVSLNNCLSKNTIMKKVLLLLSFLLTLNMITYSQDTLITKKNVLYHCQIVDVSKNHIKFFYFDNNNKKQKYQIGIENVLYCNSEKIKIDKRQNDTIAVQELKGLSAGDHLIMASNLKTKGYICTGIAIGVGIVAIYTSPILFIASAAIGAISIIYDIYSNEHIKHAGELLK